MVLLHHVILMFQSLNWPWMFIAMKISAIGFVKIADAVHCIGHHSLLSQCSKYHHHHSPSNNHQYPEHYTTTPTSPTPCGLSHTPAIAQLETIGPQILALANLHHQDHCPTPLNTPAHPIAYAESATPAPSGSTVLTGQSNRWCNKTCVGEEVGVCTHPCATPQYHFAT